MRKKLQRLLAAFFIVNILFNTFLPTISYALTSGPTAPEATSFEPVDTTDMVNLNTGDFTYSMPLLEVPGPAGSYPLSLSYHAGIQPNEDASWVGLGWTLNPGAITRLANGVPDDFDGAGSTNRVYWQGGETTVTSVGVSVGIANLATASAGLSFSQDTYRGFGVGGYVGLSIGPKFSLGKNLGGSIGINATVGISPYGGIYSSMGIALSIGSTGSAIGASAGVGLSVNSSGNLNAGLNGGIDVGKSKETAHRGRQTFGGSLIGASISSSGGAGVLTAGGFTSLANNSKEGTISTSEDSWGIDIPVFYGINISLGRSHIRYWMDETVNLKNFGSLNFPSNELSQNDKNVYDTYHIQGTESIKTGNNPQKYLEGSYADYDQYSVNAQGIAGNIRPYHYMLSLYSQDVVKQSDGSKDILNYNIPQHSVGVHFRFINDFSNKVTNDPPDMVVNQEYEQAYWSQPTGNVQMNEWKERFTEDYVANNGNTVTRRIPLFFPYGNPKTGKDGASHTRYVPNVPGSKNVEYFLNKDIFAYTYSQGSSELKSRGFLECNAIGFGRTTQNDGQVGAFTITNQSGVKYHFSLPAYAYDEFTYSGSLDEKGKLSYNVVSQPGKYAYTWYLTAVTGPDYVDRGPNGPDNILNDYDWGYWVDFQYGKWASDFQWRNPSDGFNQDVDHRFKSFSMGKKEVYYLNAIRTKTHTALFVKELRSDGKAVDPISYPINQNIPNAGGQFVLFPKASLRLNSIKVYDNRDLPNLESLYGSSASYVHQYLRVESWDGCYYLSSYPYPLSCGTVERIHNGEYVLDVNDSWFYYKPMRSIDFEYDYSSSPGTFNSFDLEYPVGGKYYSRTGSLPPQTLQPQPQPVSSIAASVSSQKKGKLTLKAITFKGKEGATLIPPTKFFYDYLEKEHATGTISGINTTEKTALVSGLGSQFSIGDLVSFYRGGALYYAYISSPGQLRFISSLGSITSGQITDVCRTKNPPYNKDFVDIWGMYKCDFREIVGSHLKNYPSQISARNTDVWSLRAVINSTGSKTDIVYESDSYREVVFPSTSIKIKSGREIVSNSNTFPGMCRTIEMEVENLGAFDFTDRFAVGGSADVALSVNLVTNDPYANKGDNCYSIATTVKEVTPSSMKVWGCLYYSGPGQQGGSNGCGSQQACYYNINFTSGKLYLNVGNKNVAGGGIRVKALTLLDELLGQERTTLYEYEINGISQGSTSYEQVPEFAESSSGCFANDGFGRISKILSLAREVPAPGVFYKTVRVKERHRNLDGLIEIPGFSEYSFEIFGRDMLGYVNSDENSVASGDSHKQTTFQFIKTRKVRLMDFTQRVGKLKSVSLFDKDGRKISETVNHYLHDEQASQAFEVNVNEYKTLADRFGGQGIIHETFNHARVVKRPIGSSYDLLGIISKKESFPAIQIGSTSINYKTGVKTDSKILSFDFYNGNPSKRFETDAYGQSFVTEIGFAYNNYSGMGLTSGYYNSNGIFELPATNKNMLEQQSSSVTYKVASVSDLTPIGVISATAQTWSDQTPVMGAGGNNLTTTQPGIWRMKSSFSFTGDNYAPLASNGDGLQAITGFQPFNNWTTHQEQAGWQRNSEVTLYDYNSHAIEATDVNGNYAATKFDNNHGQVLATAANASYNELAYSGAEEATATSGTEQVFGGGVIFSGSGISNSGHTGTKSVISNSSSQRGFSYKFNASARSYNVSLWANRSVAKIKYKINNGSTVEAALLPVRQAGGWYLINAQIDIASNNTPVEVWCEANGNATLFDDFRVHPVDAAMTSYVYNSWGELTHILDNNNLYTKYVYDEMGRLKETYKESFQTAYGNQGIVKVSEFKMNYGVLNPMMTSITATSVGVTGTVSPYGNTAVQLGKEVTFNFVNNCVGNFLQNIFIDNKQIQYFHGSITNFTLYDGTEVTVNGNTVTFKKVKSPHIIRGEFYEAPNTGFVRCETTVTNNGTLCYTGRFVYGDINPCGMETNAQPALNKSDIPAWLQPLAPDNCTVTTTQECFLQN
ncbi:MAG: hypothetical protein O9311_18930 [Cytophagales bacterium]|nr:hypothetical protein [Cytophagales bacterium]